MAATATNTGLLFIRLNNSPRVYYCDGMKTFGEAMIKYHGFERYDTEFDIYKPAFFEGLYFEADYDILKKHLGPRLVFWNGSDITRLQENKEWKKKLKGTKTHYCHNEVDRTRLEKIGVKAEVQPLFFGSLDNYPVSYVQSDNPSVFLNAHPGREDEYNVPLALEVAAEMPEIMFHIYGIDGKNEGNVVYHGFVPEAHMDQEIKDYQGCLKLNPSGISQIVVKAGLLGQYPISINFVQGAWYAPTKAAIILALEALKRQNEPNLKVRELYLDIYKKSQLKLFGGMKGVE